MEEKKKAEEEAAKKKKEEEEAKAAEANAAPTDEAEKPAGDEHETKTDL